MTTTPMFKTAKSNASALVIITALCFSLIAGFVATASKSASSGPELRASVTMSSANHAS